MKLYPLHKIIEFAEKSKSLRLWVSIKTAGIHWWGKEVVDEKLPKWELKAENLGAGVREGEGSTASVRLIEVQEVSNPSPAPGNNLDAGLPQKELPSVDIPPQVPSSAAPTSIASGLAALTTAQTEGDSPPTPLAEKKLEQVDHEEILTLEEILNKELANLVVAGLTWQTSRDKTTVLAMFYVR